jgi:hypothetical protein
MEVVKDVREASPTRYSGTSGHGRSRTLQRSEPACRAIVDRSYVDVSI